MEEKYFESQENYLIICNGKEKEIQEYLFSLGFKWYYRLYATFEGEDLIKNIYSILVTFSNNKITNKTLTFYKDENWAFNSVMVLTNDNYKDFLIKKVGLLTTSELVELYNKECFKMRLSPSIIYLGKEEFNCIDKNVSLFEGIEFVSVDINSYVGFGYKV